MLNCKNIEQTRRCFVARQERMEAEIEATWREFRTQLKEVEAGADHERGIGTGAGAAMPHKCDRTTSWAVFRPLLETVAEHNCQTCQEKSTYFITTLQGRATDLLHGVLKGAIYEETHEALEDHFGDQHLAAAYCNQLKSRTQGVGGSQAGPWAAGYAPISRAPK
jgi:hypothetical protein